MSSLRTVLEGGVGTRLQDLFAWPQPARNFHLQLHHGHRLTSHNWTVL